MRRLRALIGGALLLGAMSAASAQNGPPPTTGRASAVSSAEMRAILEKAATGPDGRPASLSKRLFDAQRFSTAFIRLSEPDRPKIHGIWSELFVVRQGSGVVQTGGTITGQTSSDSAAHRSFFVDAAPSPKPSEPEAKAAAVRREAQGDKSGTDQEGGTMVPVSAGDILYIPAGLAHRWARIDQPVVYLAIKFPKDD